MSPDLGPGFTLYPWAMPDGQEWSMRDAIVISLLARLWVEYPSFGAHRHDGRWLALEDTDEGWTRRRLAPTQVRRARQVLVRLGPVRG